MSEHSAEIDALLALCPECRQPMLLVNGVAQTRVTFWADEAGRARVTPHADVCVIPSADGDQSKEL